MGVDFELAVACFLKPETPQYVLDILSHLTGKGYDSNDARLNLPWPEEYSDLANVGPLGVLFHRYTGGTDIPGETGGVLRQVYRYNLSELQGGAPIHSYSISFRIFDDVDGLTIYMDIVRWLASYSETEGFVGYYRFVDAEAPTLIYFIEGQAYAYHVDWRPIEMKRFG